MTINERFNHIISTLYKGNKSAFASAIGIAPSVVDNIVGKRQGKPSFDVIVKLSANADIAADWLLMGRGDMLRRPAEHSILSAPVPITGKRGSPKSVSSTPTPTQPAAPTTHTPPPMPTNPDMASEPTIIPLAGAHDKKLDVSEIPLYNIDAAAGLNKLFASGGELLGKISVPNMPRCDGAVHVIGDSMYPLLKSGDIIAYRIVQSLLSLNFGEIYILQLENDGDTSIVVKYVKRSDKGDEYIKLVSYNKEHDPKDVPLFWIKAIARVTFCIRQFSII